MLKRSLILFGCCVAVAGCSKQNSASYEQNKNAPSQMDAASESAADASGPMAPPAISPTSAPGVAFNYNYSFRIPDAKISAVQEQHAAACEALGIMRCRITGMRYTLVDEDEVQAMLAFKLDPAIARKFGKDAIASVEKAEGILVDSAIQGIDVGSGITASQNRSSTLTTELTRIEKRIATAGIGDRERTELQEQAARLREQLNGERDTRRAGEESLATTPMEFTYRGGAGIPGFDNGNPFARALDTGIVSFATMLSFVLLALGVLAPWVLLGGVLVLLFRSAAGQHMRGWFTSKQRVDEIETAPPVPKKS